MPQKFLVAGFIFLSMFFDSALAGLDQNTDVNGAKRDVSISPTTQQSKGREKCTDQNNQYFINLYKVRERPEWKPLKNFDLSQDQYGTREITRYPYCLPTQKHYKKAWDLYKRSYKAALNKGWFNLENAKEQGYVQTDPIHWNNIDYNFADNSTLNPSKPEALVYIKHPESKSRLLAGVMYYKSNDISKHGKQVAGPLTVWHHHPYDGKKTCLEKQWGKYIKSKTDKKIDFKIRKKLNFFECTDESAKAHHGGEMIHVWFIPHPEGPFATLTTLPDDILKKVDKNKPQMLNKSDFMAYAKRTFHKYLIAK